MAAAKPLQRVSLAALAFVALVLLPGTALALGCERQGGGLDILEDIGVPIAVPRDMPNGTVIWTSEHRTIDVRCFKDNELRMAEYVYFYPNPRGVTLQGIEFGIRYKNVDYWSGTRVRTDAMIAECAHGIALSRCPQVQFNLSFQVLMRTRAFNGEVRPGSFPVFQFDGERGINNARQNLLYTVTGLDKIRYLLCSPRVTLFPESAVLDFGSSNPPLPGQVVSSRLLEIRVAANGCGEPVDLYAGFTTRGARADDFTLQPTLLGSSTVNRGLGFRVSRLADGAPIRFDDPFLLAHMPDDGETTASFSVQMVGLPNPVLIGPFEATLLVYVNYQ